MKRVFILNPRYCGSGDTKRYGIYHVIENMLHEYNEDEGKENIDIEYSKENAAKYPEATRWISIYDLSSQDDFMVTEDNCIVCENDNELAHVLIDHIEGVGTSIVNMALNFKE